MPNRKWEIILGEPRTVPFKLEHKLRNFFFWGIISKNSKQINPRVQGRGFKLIERLRKRIKT